MTSVGERLVQELANRGIEVVFGIPGVHTVELYRGLAGSPIRHVTSRHEQGAGFMADGYARALGSSKSGSESASAADGPRPGVAFVITGPGVTNILTAMAQARAEGSPMLVISSVNQSTSLGRGLGFLHELPNQHALVSTVALASYQVRSGDDLLPAIAEAFDQFAQGRAGPVHIEVPMDVLGLPFVSVGTPPPRYIPRISFDLAAVVAQLERAQAPLILAGGGAKRCNVTLKALAERLDAPVILTINARGLMHDHPLTVPASPSLDSVRELIAASDCVLALGTELGQTDYDLNCDLGTPLMAGLIRIDICPDQLARHPAALKICGQVETALPALIAALGQRVKNCNGTVRATAARTAAWHEIGPDMRLQGTLLATLRETFPTAIFVGDSTQPVYAGNLYYDHDRPGGWFNSASGFGTLGFAIPAAIGAALAQPDTRVICLIGDGGAQFTLPELMVAVDEALPVLFLVWNNAGYGEINSAMLAAGVAVVGCNPTPPMFSYLAKACGMPFAKCAMTIQSFAAALSDLAHGSGPAMIEIDMEDAE